MEPGPDRPITSPGKKGPDRHGTPAKKKKSPPVSPLSGGDFDLAVAQAAVPGVPSPGSRVEDLEQGRQSKKEAGTPSAAEQASSAEATPELSPTSEIGCDVPATLDDAGEPGLKRRSTFRLGCMSDSSVCWRHPLCRIFVVVMIFFEDMYMYGEDPLNDSHVVYNVPGMGHVHGLVAFFIAPSFGLGLLKFVLAVLGIIVGAIIGRQLLVQRVLRRLKIRAFEAHDGTVFVCFLTSMFMLLPAAMVYNLIQPYDHLDGASNEIFYLFGAQALEYRDINQYWQVLSASVDILALVALVDQILQDKLHYPDFAVGAKRIWTQSYGGWVRIVVAWFVFITSTALVGWGIFSVHGATGDIRAPFHIYGTDEVGRSLWASSIVFTDLLTTAQDWDFPSFHEPVHIKPTLIVGTWTPKLKITFLTRFLQLLPVPSCCHSPYFMRWIPPADFFSISIAGKWLQYGPLVGVMMIDLMYQKTQLAYEPKFYGQYVDPHDDFIYAIVDSGYLERAYDSRGKLVNASLITYAARRNVTTGAPLSPSAATDVRLNARYVNNSFKYFGVITSMCILVGAFVVLLFFTEWKEEREPEQGKESQAGKEEREPEQGNDLRSDDTE